MLFWNKICGLTTIFFLCVQFSSAQAAQIILPGRNLPANPLTKSSLEHVKRSNYKELAIPSRPLAIIPKKYYTMHFGIMCKTEVAIEKATKIPFRFRLGSLQHCNILEGKR